MLDILVKSYSDLLRLEWVRGGFILKPLVVGLHPYVALFDFPGRPSGDLGAHLR